jgi:hypothetical protein
MMLVADGFDEAIIGIGERCGQDPIVVYSVDVAIEILMERDGMDASEAMEYLEFNVIGAWVGTSTPLWVRSANRAEIDEEAASDEDD